MFVLDHYKTVSAGHRAIGSFATADVGVNAVRIQSGGNGSARDYRMRKQILVIFKDSQAARRLFGTT